MPGSFIEDDLAEMMDTDEFGTSVTYWAYQKNPITVDVIFNHEVIAVHPYTGEHTYDPPMIFANAEDLPDMSDKARFKINGEYYRVKEHPRNEGVYELVLKRESD